MKSDEILKSFDSLMKKKHKRRLSGAYEARAYKEEVQLLKEHYLFALSYEKRTKE
jgi:hypothetical protein